MAATGFGAAVIPSLMGVLARQISLEAIPVSLLVVYAGLFGTYILAVWPHRVQAASGSMAAEQAADQS